MAILRAAIPNFAAELASNPIILATFGVAIVTNAVFFYNNDGLEYLSQVTASASGLCK